MFDRVGVAHEWRPSMPCTANDLVRVVREPGCILVVMSNAGDCGWSVCWSAGSRLALDLFTDAWREATGDTSSRLEASISHVRARYLADARAEIGDDSQEDEVGGPHAGLTAVAWGQRQMVCAWIGGHMALCARDFAVTWKTTPHDFRNAAVAMGKPLPEAAVVPDVIVRCIADKTDSTHDFMAAVVNVGDVLVVADRYTHRTLGAEAIAFIASTSLSPQEAAEDLARLAYSAGNQAYASVCVLRREDVDVVAIMNGLVDAFVHDGPQGTELTRCARQARVLPLVRDMGGTFGFTVEGRAVSLGWDDLEAPPTPTRFLGYMLQGRQRLLAASPSLACVNPRPRHVTKCRRCPEWNAKTFQQPEVIGCPYCGHLGWIAPRPPNALAASLYSDSLPIAAARSRA